MHAHTHTQFACESQQILRMADLIIICNAPALSHRKTTPHNRTSIDVCVWCVGVHVHPCGTCGGRVKCSPMRWKCVCMCVACNIIHGCHTHAHACYLSDWWADVHHTHIMHECLRSNACDKLEYVCVYVCVYADPNTNTKYEQRCLGIWSYAGYNVLDVFMSMDVHAVHKFVFDRILHVIHIYTTTSQMMIEQPDLHFEKGIFSSS